MAWGVGNLGGGGSLSKAYAYVYVEYIEGADVTCTNSDKYIDITSTARIFKLNDGTESCQVVSLLNQTNRIRYATRNITGITIGSSHYIKLYYNDYLYNNGNKCLDLSGGWVAKAMKNYNGSAQTATTPQLSFGDNSFTVKQNSTGKKCGIVRTDTTLNVTPYEKIFGQITLSGIGSNEKAQLSLITSDAQYYTDTNSYAKCIMCQTIASGTTSFTYNISRFTGDVYICFGVMSNAASNIPTITVTSLWVTPLPY